jgi:hypothetical protein
MIIIAKKDLPGRKPQAVTKPKGWILSKIKICHHGD